MFLDNLFTPIAIPFGMLILWLYELINNYALALILVAIIVRGLMIPFQMKGKRGMMRQTRLQPKIAELQKKHGANKQKLNQEMANLYKEEGVNPASGCLWNFIQMPIMIAIFVAIRQPITIMMRVPGELLGNVEDGLGAIGQRLYETGFPFTGDFHEQARMAQWMTDRWDEFSEFASEGLRQMSFYLSGDFMNLSEVPNWQLWNPEYFDWSNSVLWLPALLMFFLPILSGAVNFISADIMRKMNAQPQAPSGSMGTVMKMMPLMSVVFGYILPAALSIYWTIGSVLQIGQDIWLTKKYTKILDEEDAVKDKIRKEKEAELEAKRLETERRKAEGLSEQNKNKSKNKKKKGNKQEKLEKAAKWEKENAPKESKKDKKKDKNTSSRVGDRPFARGRAYDPNRFKKKKGKKGQPELSDDSEDILTGQSDEYDDNEAITAVSSLEEAEDFAIDSDDDAYEEDDADEDYHEVEDDEPDNENDEDYDENEDDFDDSDSPNTTRFDTTRFDS